MQPTPRTFLALCKPPIGSTSATTGILWELQAITAVVVGGTALKGGAGRVWGTICGAFILELVGNIMLLSNLVSEYLIGAVQGAIIVIAMLAQRGALARMALTRWSQGIRSQMVSWRAGKSCKCPFP